MTGSRPHDVRRRREITRGMGREPPLDHAADVARLDLDLVGLPTPVARQLNRNPHDTGG